MHDNVFQVDPENKDGFALMWAGIKASYGVQSGSFDGRIAYQVKVGVVDVFGLNYLSCRSSNYYRLCICHLTKLNRMIYASAGLNSMHRINWAKHRIPMPTARQVVRR